MKKFRRELLISLAAILIVIFGAVSVYGASNVSTVLQAYKGVKIVYNGTTLTSESEPYIINNTTYVPIRMLMNKFGKDISWDATNQQVIIKNGADEINKDTQIADLKNQITALNAKISGLETALGNADTTIRTIDEALSKYSKTTTSSTGTPATTTPSTGSSANATLDDIEGTLNDNLVDVGDDYFDDNGIQVVVELSGDKDDLAYAITFDFDDADDYDNLTEVKQSDIKSFLNVFKVQITAAIDGTDYEDADVTGKLSDYDKSSYYVKYNGSSYTFSWNEGDGDISDTEEYLQDYFEDAGDTYLSDDDVVFDISLTGDEDDLSYKIYANFDDSSDYDDLSDTNKTYIKNFLVKVRSIIISELDGTDYEDADITGYLIDDDQSGLYVRYNGDSYSYSY